MLKELRCEKLLKNKLTFHSGLNALTGPDDGANSIGKSSVLMLIDFALAGDDFLKLCANVIENVGIITIEMDFIFDEIKYSFSRSTNDPKTVIFKSEQNSPEKTIDEYRFFLKTKYNFPESGASFRSVVNPFFRIWGKDNYNPNKPLNSFPSEPYSNIKPNLIKIFSLQDGLNTLTKEKSKIEKKKNILKGVFEEGYIKPLTKRDSSKVAERLKELEKEIDEIKKSIENHSINASQIISEESIKIKSEKDDLVRTLLFTKNKLKRISDNLTYGSTLNKKSFDKLQDYFPDVNIEKLAKIEQFHSGVSKILKAELKDEKEMLEEQLNSLTLAISSAEIKLLETTGMLEKPSGLVDKMLELSFEEKNLREQMRFRDIKSSVESKVSELNDEITLKTVESLVAIENTLNISMSKFISRFYENNPVVPQINLLENRYEFSHNADSGTGKAYANMISLDMSFLEKTYLPILIHDLIVFSNIEDHAMEKIIFEYSSSQKQIFIAIDKLARLSKVSQSLIKQNEFLTLSPEKLAFKKSWKKRT
ncbi:DUF2326 domain-containing protein [Tolumonas auensis]|uniref:DUF2326 domain-containing protein n=1 Tax=Tolumonas auensis TaxID=43948 RepID=UPI002AA7E5FD|nr:DUF2326 domain-containing protein [Tolumonas auensis]